jgi:hypothetical protein
MLLAAFDLIKFTLEGVIMKKKKVHRDIFIFDSITITTKKMGRTTVTSFLKEEEDRILSIVSFRQQSNWKTLKIALENILKLDFRNNNNGKKYIIPPSVGLKQIKEAYQLAEDYNKANKNNNLNNKDKIEGRELKSKNITENQSIENRTENRDTFSYVAISDTEIVAKYLLFTGIKLIKHSLTEPIVPEEEKKRIGAILEFAKRYTEEQFYNKYIKYPELEISKVKWKSAEFIKINKNITLKKLLKYKNLKSDYKDQEQLESIIFKDYIKGNFIFRNVRHTYIDHVKNYRPTKKEMQKIQQIIVDYKKQNGKSSIFRDYKVLEIDNKNYFEVILEENNSESKFFGEQGNENRMMKLIPSEENEEHKPSIAEMSSLDIKGLSQGMLTPEKITREINLIKRNQKLVTRLKELYDNTCQICGLRVNIGNGFYCEVHHIKPLGKNHNGPDTMDNMLCVCPNHHIMFDMGALSIDLNNWTVIHKDEDEDIHGRPILKKHNINNEYIKYNHNYIFETVKNIIQTDQKTHSNISLLKKSAVNNKISNYDKVVVIKDCKSGEIFSIHLESYTNRHLMDEIENMVLNLSIGGNFIYKGHQYIIHDIK